MKKSSQSILPHRELVLKTRHHKNNESGYSMVEVLVAILILVIAIVPMFAMFDLGLRTATTNSNYDKARALAEKQVEFAQSIPYDDVKGTDFPSDCTTPADPLVDGEPITGCRDDSNDSDPDNPGPYSNLEYDVTKTYIIPNIADDVVVMEPAEPPGTDKGMIQLEICVYREDSSCEDYIFKTTGVVVEQDES